MRQQRLRFLGHPMVRLFLQRLSVQCAVWWRPFDLFLVLYLLISLIVAFWRGFVSNRLGAFFLSLLLLLSTLLPSQAALDCHLAPFQFYRDNVEPYMKDPVFYPKLQVRMSLMQIQLEYFSWRSRTVDSFETAGKLSLLFRYSCTCSIFRWSMASCCTDCFFPDALGYRISQLSTRELLLRWRVVRIWKDLIQILLMFVQIFCVFSVQFSCSTSFLSRHKSVTWEGRLTGRSVTSFAPHLLSSTSSGRWIFFFSLDRWSSPLEYSSSPISSLATFLPQTNGRSADFTKLFTAPTWESTEVLGHYIASKISQPCRNNCFDESSRREVCFQRPRFLPIWRNWFFVPYRCYIESFECCKPGDSYVWFDLYQDFFKCCFVTLKRRKYVDRYRRFKWNLHN